MMSTRGPRVQVATTREGVTMSDPVTGRRGARRVRQVVNNLLNNAIRFTRVGEIEGAIVIDDYAHHPVEIRAVLSAARDSSSGRER